MACVVGASVPLHTTAVGKSYVAALPEAQREGLIGKLDFVAVTERSITSAKDFREQIARVRSEGYAVDEQENERDIVCFGAPILDRMGTPTAAISVRVPRFRLQSDSRRAYVTPLLDTCTRVSSLLGFRPRTGGRT